MRKRTIATLLLSCMAVFVCWSGPAVVQADDEKTIKKRKPTRFLRIEQDEFGEPVSLQTATAKYILNDGNRVKLEVYLESVVHIGDAAYYRGFNRRFKHYDTVLYELIAPKKRRIPESDNDKTHPLRLLQQVASEGLGFVHQLDEIEYDVEHMVHSDLSPKEMAAARVKRGEDEFTILADVVLHTLRKMNRDALKDDGEPKKKPREILDFDVLSDPEGGVKIRRGLARSIASESPEMALFPSQAATLIDDRNDHAMVVFQKALDAGKRRIALFWGAAHMPDFEQRLMLDYGMELDSVHWRNAWDLRDGTVARAPLEAVLENSLRSVFDELLEGLRKNSTTDKDHVGDNE